jgi:TPR repeat protein
MKKAIAVALLLSASSYMAISEPCHVGCLCFKSHCATLCEVQSVAEAGDPEAIYQLAAIHASGGIRPAGIAFDPAGAAKKIEELAWQGYLPAEQLAGAFRQYGLLSYVQKDIVKAYFWYAVASAGGDGKASESLCNLQGLISPQDRERADAMVSQWLSRQAGACPK